jgi:hypothetical protein
MSLQLAGKHRLRGSIEQVRCAGRKATGRVSSWRQLEGR